MKKQIKRAFAIVSLLVIAAVCTVASAQVSRTVVVNVPFDFVVGNERLPAGEYTVRPVSRNSEKTLLVRSLDGSAAATVITNAVESGAATDKAKLNFTRYEDQYFLAQIWTPGSRAGREVPKSRLQKNLEHELAERGKAGAEGTTVTVVVGVR